MPRADVIRKKTDLPFQKDGLKRFAETNKTNNAIFVRVRLRSGKHKTDLEMSTSFETLTF